jgi:hypothetical protein
MRLPASPITDDSGGPPRRGGGLLRYRTALLVLAALVVYLLVALVDAYARGHAGRPFDAEFFTELAEHIMGEVGAAIIAGLVAVLLIDAASRRELEHAVDRRLGAASDRLEQLQTQIRDEMRAAGMCYRMFGHPADDSVIRSINRRILENPILRRSQDIVCDFQHAGPGDGAWLEMRCECTVRYDNLSDQPKHQGFSLVIDRERTPGRRPLRRLRLIPLEGAGYDGSSVEMDLDRDLEEETAAPQVYAIHDRRDGDGRPANAAFIIPGGRSVRHVYEYAIRQPLHGREDFCMLGVTGKMTVRATSGHPDRMSLRLEPQTDLAAQRVTSVTGGVELEVGPVLLPMQGIVVHWSYTS